LAPTGPSVERPKSLDAIDDEPDEFLAQAADSIPATEATTVEQPVSTLGEALAIDAVEIDRLVPASGNLGVCGQLRYAGQIVTIEVDETTLRVYDQRNHLIKNVPRTSRKEVRRHKAYGHTTSHTTA
jgi:hypothetical protein